MNLKDKIYFLLSYTNSEDIKTKYPNLKSIALINIIGVILYFIIPSFIVKALYTLILLAVDFCFKETRGIIITFTPIIIWVLLFSSAKDIPMSWRRDIDVNTLYSLEEKLGLICFKFYAKNENVFFDLLAWLPYGIIHYIMPVLVGFYLVLFYKPGYTSPYLFFFGIMNTIGVITQLVWPTAPPWYYIDNGTSEAHYGMHGNPAGLQKIDDLFHMNFYYTTFTGNPLPWGAWPSLHSGFASYSAIFLTYLYPKYCPFFFIYVAWIWWATMYLGHHYFVDVIGGFVYALVCALGAILYLLYTQPYHKEYTELKSIVIQDCNDFDQESYRDLKNNYYLNNAKRETEISDTEMKYTGASTLVESNIKEDEKASTSSNENVTYRQDSKNTNSINNPLNVPNADTSLEKASMVSNIGQDSSTIEPYSSMKISTDITNMKYF